MVFLHLLGKLMDLLQRFSSSYHHLMHRRYHQAKYPTNRNNPLRNIQRFQNIHFSQKPNNSNHHNHNLLRFRNHNFLHLYYNWIYIVIRVPKEIIRATKNNTSFLIICVFLFYIEYNYESFIVEII